MKKSVTFFLISFAIVSGICGQPSVYIFFPCSSIVGNVDTTAGALERFNELRAPLKTCFFLSDAMQI